MTTALIINVNPPTINKNVNTPILNVVVFGSPTEDKKKVEHQINQFSELLSCNLLFLISLSIKWKKCKKNLPNNILEVKLNNSISGIINCPQCSHLDLPDLHQSQTWWTTKRNVFIQNTAHLAFNFTSKFHRQISTYTFFLPFSKISTFYSIDKPAWMEGGVAFFVTHNSDSGTTKNDFSSRMWIFFSKYA